MQLSDLIGLLYLTEKFRFMDLLDGGEEYEIDSFSPVYKSLYDEYLGTDSQGYPIDIKREYKMKLFYHTDLSTSDKIPIFRTYFDWTSDFARGTRMGDEDKFFDYGNNWPIQVEIRVELSEPRADTIQAIGGRKFLRGGTLQFLITAPTNIFTDINKETQLVLGKPMGSVFRIAQFYVDKYGSTDAMQLLKEDGDIPDIKEGLENISFGKNQFEDTTLATREQIMGILFPESDFDQIHYIKIEDPNDSSKSIWIKDPGNLPVKSGAAIEVGYIIPDPAIGKEGDYYVLIHKYMTLIDRVKSFRTLTAVVTNIRFVPKDRIPVKLFNATYGLAVTIPFTYEQQK